MFGNSDIQKSDTPVFKPHSTFMPYISNPFILTFYRIVKQ